jgi:hypothetical protein
MNMRTSVTTSIETKMLAALRAANPGVECVGLMEVAADGIQKEQQLTSAQVRVYGLAQATERSDMYTCSAEVRLNVEQAESANGATFLSAHEAIAVWLEDLAMGEACEALDTDEAFVDGLMLTGGDKDFDTTDGVWFAIWQATITGRVKHNQTGEENNG